MVPIGHSLAAVLAVRERGEHDRHVVFPRRRGVDDVEVVARDELLERVVAGRVDRRRRLSFVGDHLRRALRFVGDDVAQRDDPHAFDAEQFVEHRAPAKAGADDPDAHRFVPVERNRAHRCASRRRRRCEVGLSDRADVLGDGRRPKAGRSHRDAGQRRRLEEVAPAQRSAIVREVGHVSVLFGGGERELAALSPHAQADRALSPTYFGTFSSIPYLFSVGAIALAFANTAFASAIAAGNAALASA